MKTGARSIFPKVFQADVIGVRGGHLTVREKVTDLILNHNKQYFDHKWRADLMTPKGVKQPATATKPPLYRTESDHVYWVTDLDYRHDQPYATAEENSSPKDGPVSRA